MKGRAKEGGGGKEERLQPGVAKRRKKKACDSPASGREPSVFAGAETGAEQTGGEEKHTHIVLCVVVGNFIILQTSRTETQTFIFFYGGPLRLCLTHTHTPSSAVRESEDSIISGGFLPSLANDDSGAGERSDKYCMSEDDCAESLSFPSIRPVCRAPGSCRGESPHRVAFIVALFFNVPDHALLYSALIISYCVVFVYIYIFSFPGKQENVLHLLFKNFKEAHLTFIFRTLTLNTGLP